MPDFKNLKTLYRYLEKQIQESLENEVADDVSKIMKIEIKKNVYDVYEPKEYERKYDKGGLVDDANIKTEVKGNTLIVENIRRDEENPNKNVAYIVETGKGYTYNVPDFLRKGRPFTEKTRERLKNENIVLKSLKESLENRGIDVE